MKKLSANKVSQHLDISVATLTNWYNWYANCEHPESVPELPAFQRDGKRGTRYWSEEDLIKLEEFKKWIPRGRAGVMGAYNARFWGARGKKRMQAKKV